MLPLAVSVAVVGLGALPTLGQVAAALAEMETLGHVDPKSLFIGLALPF